jgi:D-hexose-6-phosphate mutarotase
LEYIDKVEAGAKAVEERQEITIGSEVDRIYKNVNGLIILDIGNGSTIQIEKSNLKDTGMFYSHLNANVYSFY